MSDDAFRINPRTQLPPSIFEQPPPAASQPEARGGATLGAPRDSAGRAPAQHGAAHRPGHHPDDLPREVAHSLHTALETCEKAKTGYDTLRAHPTPQALQQAARQLDLGARKLNGAVARLEILAETGNPKAAAALPGARRQLAAVQGSLRKAQDQLAALPRPTIATRASAAGRELIDKVERQPRQSATAVATRQPPTPGRLGHALDKAHAFASRPGLRGLGKFAGVAGTALDAYQGWRESTADHPYWRARTAAAYAIAGTASRRSLIFAIPDMFTLGAVSDHFKRTALSVLATEQAVMSGDTQPLETLTDRSARGEHGKVWKVASTAGRKIIP
jgi:hypothetical protein